MISITGARSFNTKKIGFWKRQFSDSATTPQLIFDLIFGIAMPILCFYFDPGIISSRYSSGSYLSLDRIAIAIYMFSGLAVLGLSFWLGLRCQADRYAAIIAGIFMSAAVFAFVIGIVMLPITLIGLLFVIGILGFVPFATGLVFLRNGMRAINHAKSISVGGQPARLIVATALMSVCLPFLVQWQVGRAVNRSVDEIVNSRTGFNESAICTVKHLRWFADTDPIVRAYSAETDIDRKLRLASAYKEITGRDVERRMWVLND